MHWNKAEIIHEEIKKDHQRAERNAIEQNIGKGHQLTKAIRELNRFYASYDLLNNVPIMSSSLTSNGNKIGE
jgi:hypothetical protein